VEVGQDAVLAHGDPRPAEVVKVPLHYSQVRRAASCVARGGPRYVVGSGLPPSFVWVGVHLQVSGAETVS
jgi:hypothetical protein